MSAITARCATALACAVMAVLLIASPASATFAGSAAVAPMTVSTAVVAPPTGVTAVLSSCSNGRWMSVTVSWTASASPRITGYDVQAHRSDGTTVDVGQVSASTTTVTTTVDRLSSGSTTLTFTVIAQLNGWTAGSVSSGPITC